MLDYSGIEGKVLALGGAVYFLKIKVYSVAKPKFANIFIVFAKKRWPDFKGYADSEHAVFIESESLKYFSGRNSWGEDYSHFTIRKEFDLER